MSALSLLILLAFLHTIATQPQQSDIKVEIGCQARCLAKCSSDDTTTGDGILLHIPQKCWELCSYYNTKTFAADCQLSPTCISTCLNISIGESDVANDLRLKPTNLATEVVESSVKTKKSNLIRLTWDAVKSDVFGQPVYLVQLRNNSKNATQWQTLPAISVNNAVIEISSPCDRNDLRIFAAFEQGLSQPSKIFTTESKQPGAVTGLQLKKIFYRSRKKFVYLDISWVPPANWLTKDIRDYNVSAEFTDCKLDKKVTEIWPALRHKLGNSESASIMFPDIYADKGCRLLFEINSVASVCGPGSNNSRSSLIVPLNCEQQVILNYPCNTAKLITPPPVEPGLVTKPPGFDPVGNLSCLHDGIQYEISEIEADDEVSLEIRWTFPPSVINLTYFWLRYGKLRRLPPDQIFVINDDDNIVITLSKDTTQTTVTDLEMDVEYGFQICAAFAPNQPQPRWDDVTYQLIKIDQSSINSLCSIKMDYTQDQRKVEGTGAIRHFVRIHWEMPDGVEAMGPIYAKWGFARRTSTGFEDLEFQGRTEVKQLAKNTKVLLMDNVLPGSTYGIQICAFDASIAPTSTMWLSHSRIYPIVVPEEPAPTIAAKVLEEKKASSVWLYTCVIVMAIVTILSTIIAVLCHICTSRGHTIGTVKTQLSLAAWKKDGRNSSVRLALRERKLGREESNLQQVVNGQTRNQLRI